MRIALFGNNSTQETTDQIRRLLVNIEGVEVVDENPEMVLSIGGDGTFLRAAAKIGISGVPILGVNAGHLGFLADVPLSDAASVLPMVLSERRYQVEQRAMLSIDIPGCRQPYQSFALNEVAILKRDQSSMVSVRVYVDGNLLNQYDGDGLVIATPTGSTAYAMSAGGPILEPQSGCWVIVPIAPHSLTCRPMVIRDDRPLEIQVESRNSLYLVAIDGTPLHLTTQYSLRLSRSEKSIGVVRREDSTFFDTLRTKFHWGR